MPSPNPADDSMICYPGASTLSQKCERYTGPFSGTSDCPDATGKCQKGYQINCGSTVSGAYIPPILSISDPDECRQRCDENPQCVLFVQSKSSCGLYSRVDLIVGGYAATAYKKICEPVPVVSSSSESLPSPTPISESSATPSLISSVEPSSSVDPFPTSSEEVIPSSTSEPTACLPGASTLPQFCEQYTGPFGGASDCPGATGKCQKGYKISCTSSAGGSIIKPISNAIPDDCRVACDENPECIAFVHLSNRTCVLLRKVNSISGNLPGYSFHEKVCEPAPVALTTSSGALSSPTSTSKSSTIPEST